MKDCKAARWTRAPLAACIAAAMFGGVAMDVGAAQTGAGNAPLGQGEDLLDHPPLGMNDAHASAANDLIPPAKKPRKWDDARLESLVNSRKSHEVLRAQARAEKKPPVVEGKQVRAVPARQVDAQRARAQRELSERLSQQKPSYRLNEHGQVVPVDQNELHGAPSHGASKKAGKPRDYAAERRKREEVRTVKYVRELARIDKYMAAPRLGGLKKPVLAQVLEHPLNGGGGFFAPGVGTGEAYGAGPGQPGQLQVQLPSVLHDPAFGALGQISDDIRSKQDGEQSPTAQSQSEHAGGDALLASLDAMDVMEVLLRCEDCQSSLGPAKGSDTNQVLQGLRDKLTIEGRANEPLDGMWAIVTGNEFSAGLVDGDDALAHLAVKLKEPAASFNDLPHPGRIAAVVARASSENPNQPRHVVVTYTRDGQFTAPAGFISKATNELIPWSDDCSAGTLNLRGIEYVIYRPEDDA